MIDVIEQVFDVELDRPVVFPASTPHERFIQRRTSRTVVKRVAVEYRLETRSATGHAKNAHSPALLRTRHGFDRRRKAAAGFHSTPKLVQAIVELLLKLQDRLFINAAAAPE